jgi:cysteine synthase A
MLANDVLHTIGNTPHIRINRLFGSSHNVYVKSERSNPGGSIKDRIAVAMVEAAEASGALKPARRSSSRPRATRESAWRWSAPSRATRRPRHARQHERRAAPPDARLRRPLRADAAREGRQRRDRAAQEIVAELSKSSPGAWMPQQFDNAANIDVHVRTTAQEIAADFPSGVDALITGVGTGGHITGCAQVLKKMWPKLKVYAVEPAASPVISGGQPSPHPIQGIGAGFVPKNLHVDLLDGVILVEAEAAREMARRSAREEGLLVGVSSGATLAAIAQKLPDLPAGATVLGFNYDTGERYLSIEGFLPE